MNYKRKTLLLTILITIFSLVFTAISSCRKEYETISVGEPLAPSQSSEISSEGESGEESSPVESSSPTDSESSPSASSSETKESDEESVSSSDDFEAEESSSENDSEDGETSDSSSTPDTEEEQEHRHVPVTLEKAEGTCIWRGLTEGSYCASCKEILTEQKETEYGEHSFENCVCAYCGLLQLNYTLEWKNYEDIGYDEPYYICSAPEGIITSAVHRIVIPDMYEGRAVACIKAGSFVNFYGLYSLEIGANIIQIGAGSFTNCTNLVEIYDKSSAKISKNEYFAKQAKAVYYQPYDSNITQSRDGFATYKSGEEVILIGYDGEAVDVVIPDFVTLIHPYAFAVNDITQSVTVPSKVRYIYVQAFIKCARLEKIILENPEGWECSMQETQGYMPVVEDLSDATLACEVFVGDFQYYYWKQTFVE